MSWTATPLPACLTTFQAGRGVMCSMRKLTSIRGRKTATLAMAPLQLGAPITEWAIANAETSGASIVHAGLEADVLGHSCLRIQRRAGWWPKATHSEHPMPKTQVESLALTPLPFIPDLLVPMAKVASAAGQGVACISKLLKQLAARHSLEVTWSDDNVRTLLDASRTSVVLDATMLVEALHMRDKESGLAFFVHTGADGSLERVFFALHGGMETYALMESKAFIHYDTTVCLAELPINTCPSN